MRYSAADNIAYSSILGPFVIPLKTIEAYELSTALEILQLGIKSASLLAFNLTSTTALTCVQIVLQCRVLTAAGLFRMTFAESPTLPYIIPNSNNNNNNNNNNQSNSHNANSMASSNSGDIDILAGFSDKTRATIAFHKCTLGDPSSHSLQRKVRGSVLSYLLLDSVIQVFLNKNYDYLLYILFYLLNYTYTSIQL